MSIASWIDRKKDKVLFFDKNMRWRLKTRKTKFSDLYHDGEKTYHIDDKATYLNKKGVSLIIYYENKPQPLQIQANKIEWLDSKSLRSVINNEQVRKIITPKNPVLDQLMVFGMIAAIVGCLGVLLIAGKVFGLIGGGGG